MARTPVMTSLYLIPSMPDFAAAKKSRVLTLAEKNMAADSFVARMPVTEIALRINRSVSAVWRLVSDERLDGWVGVSLARQVRWEFDRRQRDKGRCGILAREMAAKYINGEKIEVIAIECGVDYASTYRTIFGLQAKGSLSKEITVAIKKERKRRKAAFSGAAGKRERIEALLSAGLSVKEIAAKFSCSESWVRRVKAGKKR